jgi:hypothetical protein
MSEEDRARFFYKATGCEESLSWEEFSERKVFVVPIDGKDEGRPRGHV